MILGVQLIALCSLLNPCRQPLGTKIYTLTDVGFSHVLLPIQEDNLYAPVLVQEGAIYKPFAFSTSLKAGSYVTSCITGRFEARKVRASCDYCEEGALFAADSNNNTIFYVCQGTGPPDPAYITVCDSGCFDRVYGACNAKNDCVSCYDYFLLYAAEHGNLVDRYFSDSIICNSEACVTYLRENITGIVSEVLYKDNVKNYGDSIYFDYYHDFIWTSPFEGNNCP